MWLAYVAEAVQAGAHASVIVTSNDRLTLTIDHAGPAGAYVALTRLTVILLLEVLHEAWRASEPRPDAHPFEPILRAWAKQPRELAQVCHPIS